MSGRNAKALLTLLERDFVGMTAADDARDFARRAITTQKLRAITSLAVAEKEMTADIALGLTQYVTLLIWAWLPRLFGPKGTVVTPEMYDEIKTAATDHHNLLEALGVESTEAIELAGMLGVLQAHDFSLSGYMQVTAAVEKLDEEPPIQTTDKEDSYLYRTWVFIHLLKALLNLHYDMEEMESSWSAATAPASPRKSVTLTRLISFCREKTYKRSNLHYLAIALLLHARTLRQEGKKVRGWWKLRQALRALRRAQASQAQTDSVPVATHTYFREVYRGGTLNPVIITPPSAAA